MGQTVECPKEENVTGKRRKTSKGEKNRKKCEKKEVDNEERMKNLEQTLRTKSEKRAKHLPCALEEGVDEELQAKRALVATERGVDLTCGNKETLIEKYYLKIDVRGTIKCIFCQRIASKTTPFYLKSHLTTGTCVVQQNALQKKTEETTARSKSPPVTVST